MSIFLHNCGDNITLVRANTSSSDADRLTDEELLGQMKWAQNRARLAPFSNLYLAQ